MHVNELKVKPSFLPDLFQIGYDKTGVLVIDDFAANLDQVREDAGCGRAYQNDGLTAYPGIRRVAPDSYVNPLMAAFVPVLRKVHSIPDDLEARCELAFYSLLTKAGADLDVAQRLPHSDTNKQHYYAILHYLNAGNYGGTGFFRHRPTRFERVTEDRREIYNQSVSAFMAVRGLPAHQYINASNNHFELFSQVDYKPNRVVAYPGCLLHSALVTEDEDVSDDPAIGRLTANVFVSFS